MIKDNLKRRVAGNVMDYITEIVLNDTVSIKTFDRKYVANTTCYVNFALPSEIDTVTKITVLSEDEVICESNLYFERKEDVQFSYRIEVQ